MPFIVRLEPKYDGAALRLLYKHDGNVWYLMQAATRGTGQDTGLKQA